MILSTEPPHLPLVTIVGETASGKSALALKLARHFNGELICADSWTVYKGFNIGTAKPAAAEQRDVPHHLLDVADPSQGFSAVEFQRLAKQAITAIQQRGRLPIMVGGTGLYIDSVLYEYGFLPPPAATLRQELNRLSLDQLLVRLADDGLDASGIDLRNKRRIIRLIENAGTRPTKSSLRPRTLILGISTDRQQLSERITARVDAMIEAGLETEVCQLALEYGWQAEPMKGIGYREWQAKFESSQSLEQTRQRIIAATVSLAKRQRTWFKRNDRIHWLQPPNTEAASIELVTTFLDNLQVLPAARLCYN